MTPPLSRVIYFSLDTDRLFTNFDAALHQEFISLGERLGLTYVGTGKDPRQMEEENNHLKEQVRYLTAFNSSLVSTTSSLNERMGKMATVINEQASSTLNHDKDGDSIEEEEEITEIEKETTIKFTGTNSRQTGSDV
ncbi:hypothetical protein PRIPAC_83238 [Pristionchus pacificus]|uniref:Uncharacterized protein n=1 Tax=Pristionchus pacificus TaxID=54126 RepID=A0A2A6C4K4_PRIPA|nr:hypothetical protein PRIPAC_83238 [Pristionchus pacificus]|eukprot:PDM73152.1 hypothetical protein PRIPAC_43248 [Pristionchus pacificus]